MAGTKNDVLVGKNADFTQVNAPNAASAESNGLVTNGKLWIGSTVVNAGGTHINVGALTSPLGTLSIGYSSPNITLDLVGGSTAIDSVAVQTGTSPVVPTAAGLITFNGATVAAGTNPVRTNGTGANTYALQVQISQALAATDATKIGLANFNSTQFTVDANGFVSASGTGIATTITGDSGGALSPTANNWNILGRSGSKTSGAVSTLTIKSPPYADAGGSATSTLNSGSFVTGAFTLTLPASAGLADGDLFEYVATSAAITVIQAVGTQQIRIGNALSSAAGTATSSGLAGDSITLRFRATDGFFYATSVIGVWVTA